MQCSELAIFSDGARNYKGLVEEEANNSGLPEVSTNLEAVPAFLVLGGQKCFFIANS